MKSRITSIILLAALLFSVIVVPAYAASGYDYVMIYRVDGKAQGQFHSLSKGTVDISGFSFYTGAAESWAVSSTKGETVSYYLYKDDSFADSYYGSVSQYVPSSANTYNVARFSDSFSKSADVESGNYYLVIVKEDNGWKMKGEGTLN